VFIVSTSPNLTGKKQINALPRHGIAKITDWTLEMNQILLRLDAPATSLRKFWCSDGSVPTHGNSPNTLVFENI
jgi:hypothetical protein